MFLFNKETHNSERVENLYAIKFTPAGPILKPVYEVKLSEKERISPETYFKLKKETFTFDEGKRVVVEWFIDRASYIERLTEEEYFRISDTKERNFTEFMGEYFDEMGEMDFAGGRA